MLSERVKEWSRDWKQQGIEQGRQEGEPEFLLRQLEWRFGPVSDAVRNRIKAAETPILLTWGKRILTAQTIEDVFED